MQTYWLIVFFISIISAEKADTSENLLDYINVSKNVICCDQKCTGLFLPYAANSNGDCDEKTLADFEYSEIPSYSNFCQTHFEMKKVLTPYGRTQYKVIV